MPSSNVNIDTDTESVCKLDDASRDIPRTLIYSQTSPNKTAYLQNSSHPSIDDIYKDGKITYKNCYQINDLFKNLNSHSRDPKEQYAIKINDFFKYM